MNDKGRPRVLAAMLAAAMLAATPAPAGAETATFVDGAHDAYRLPSEQGAPPPIRLPNPYLSDPAADILEASFATVSRTSKKVSYSASMKITGTPRTDYSYVVGGYFGADCQLYHFLTPALGSYANAWCGTGESRRFVGQISGSTVVSDDNVVTATYSYTRLPSALSDDPTLEPLFGFTCVSGLEGVGCRAHEALDTAKSPPLTSFDL